MGRTARCVFGAALKFARSVGEGRAGHVRVYRNARRRLSSTRVRIEHGIRQVEVM